ncbi:hypothetical protein DFQ28_003006 [Apophysomyces sp. BC1034]|nr:hypothetical protein DFQ30_011376 [Apophysomyces sp. BC1015]KAG0177958.1 hypothetical protein DFQ29_004142 [Apophysomyces sp. BC1021]KAG0193854.1 hypothetical protein DFQ28_003006 [Apophysomyces sp. BC1034]
MTGLTIAHQLVSNDTEDSFPKLKSRGANEPVVTDEQLNELLAGTSHAWPETVEDLTGEVQDLMMRQWLQPYSDNNTPCLEGFDPQLYAQSIQDLFGQDEFNFDNDATASPFYDEMTFGADDASLTISASTSSSSSPAQSPLVHPTVLDALEDISCQELDELVPEEQTNTVISPMDTPLHAMNMKRRRSSSSSESDSCDDSSDDSDSEDDCLIPTTVATLSGRRRRVSYSSSSDDSEFESDSPMTRTSSSADNSYKYMQKRQIEETLLDKITNQLHADKLPGILSILSSENAGHQNDEVEIDLSRLAREQLVRVLAYVEACIAEQDGGPAVDVADYIVKVQVAKRKGPRTRPALERSSEDEEEEDYNEPVRRQRKPRKPRQKKRCSKEVDGDMLETLDASGLSNGPISMSALSKRQPEAKQKRSRGGRKPAGKRKGQTAQVDDEAVISPALAMIHDEDSIAVSRPKRRAALHKRRLLEEMLQPSDNEDEDEEEVLVVYSEEQMDMAVTANQTIVHQPDTPVPVAVPVVSSESDEEEENDEEIDIML